MTETLCYGMVVPTVTWPGHRLGRQEDNTAVSFHSAHTPGLDHVLAAGELLRVSTLDELIESAIGDLLHLVCHGRLDGSREKLKAAASEIGPQDRLASPTLVRRAIEVVLPDVIFSDVDVERVMGALVDAAGRPEYLRVIALGMQFELLPVRS